MDRYKYFLQVDSEKVELHPSGVEGLQTVFTLADELKFSHEVEIAGDIVLTGVDYNLFYGIETSGKRCGDNFIYIEKLCSGQYVPWITGLLNVIDGTYDIDKCNISISITAIDGYYCFDYNKKRDIDIFDVTPYDSRVKVKAIRGTIETYEVGPTSNWDPYDPDINSGVDPRENKWLAYRAEYWSDGNYNPRGAPVTTARYYYFAREVLTTSCSVVTPGPEWKLIEDNCPSNKKWARFPIRVNYKELGTNWYETREPGTTDFVPSNPSYLNPAPIRYFASVAGEDSNKFAYDVMGLSGTPSDFDNGIRLSDFFKFFINKFCGIPVKSDFFQINPEHIFSDTYPYLPGDKRTENLIIFQKSDVKRLNARNNATKGVTTLEKMIKDILTLFNCQYRIKDGVFVVEHVSFWERNITIDLTLDKYAKNMAFSSKYSYEKDKLPQFEEFDAMEMGSPDFVGVPIEYFGRCVNFDDDTKIKERRLESVTTDVEYCLKYSKSDSDKVSDLGFVIMSAQQEGNDLFIMVVQSILEPYPKLNNPLSWAHIQEAYYQYGRPQKIGLMNNVFHTFKTTIEIKKQASITIPFCCTDTLILSDKVRTKIGDGIISRATLDHYKETLELDLLYENPYQEAFCTAIKNFSLNNATYYGFFFDVEFFDCTQDYTIIIEATIPGGTVIVSDIIAANCGTPVQLELNSGNGQYKFRAKNICGDEQSDWSNYVTVDFSATSECGLLPYVSFVERSNQTLFIFTFTETSFSDNIDIEITGPDGTKTIKQNATWVQNGSQVNVSFDFNNHPGTPGRIFKGLYQFRFRRRCGSFTTSLFGSYLNVTVS